MRRLLSQQRLVCAADSSQICADISSLTVTSNGKNSSSSAGKITVTPDASVFTFRFTSNATLARKWLNVGFFDISSGIHLLPAVGDPTASNACAAAGAIGKSCGIQTDASGAASFSVKILNGEAGKGFSYLISGPAGFSSASKRVAFTVTGTNQVPAEAYPTDQTRVCAPITRLSMKQDNKNVVVSYNQTGAGSATLSTAPAEITFQYSSSADYANKWMFMKFLNATAGVLTIIDSGDATSHEACGAADAVANGCLVQLDGKGSASFIVTFAGGAAGKTVQYEIAGPRFDSKLVTISFGPQTVFAPIVVRQTQIAIAGKSGVVAVTATNARGKTVAVTLPGARVVKFVASKDVQTFYFPRQKGAVEVTVVIGKSTKSANVRVS